jgi:hypothetical protein
MTLTEDITMGQQVPAVTVLPGCDLFARGIRISGVVGVHVRGGTVRFDEVTIDTHHPAVDVAAEARVFISGARWQCGGRCLMVREGTVTLEDSELSAAQFAVDVGGKVVVRRSRLSGGVAALSLHSGGEAKLIESTLKSSDRALSIHAGQGSVTFEGGRVEGRIAGNGGMVMGLETVTVELGAGARQTWAEFACAPITTCLAQQPLGEFVADLRVDLTPDGRLGPPDFVQKKLDPAAEDCIVLGMSQLGVPGPDGQPHVVRCTISGQLMPGGAMMASSDHRVEQ